MNSWYPGTGMGRDCMLAPAGQAREGQTRRRFEAAALVEQLVPFLRLRKIIG